MHEKKATIFKKKLDAYALIFSHNQNAIVRSTTDKRMYK